MSIKNNTYYKKVGFIITSPSWGGLEINVLKLARLLVERHWEVLLFLIKGSMIALEANMVFKQIYYIEKHKKYFDIPEALKFSRLLKKHEINTLLAFDNRDLDFVYFTKLFCPNRLNVIYQQQMQIGVNKKDFIHTLRFSAIDHWIAPLELLKNEVINKTKLNPDKIKVIPLSTDVNKFVHPLYTKTEARNKLQLKHSAFIIGIIGRIDPKKGQLFLIKAVHLLREKNQNIELLIVGEPTVGEVESKRYMAELKKYVSQHQLSEFIQFRHFTKDVSLFYNAIDLFVLASEGETFGMVTIEAMLSGVPIIATNTVGTPEILNNGELGHLYKPNDIAGFCDSIKSVLSNPNKAKEMAKNAQKKAIEEYSQDTECKRIEELLNAEL